MKVGFIAGAAAGAIPNGARIRKVAGDPGDTHLIGALGTVLSSHGPFEFPTFNRTDYAYFVEWDDLPGLPVFVAGFKIEDLKQ